MKKKIIIYSQGNSVRCLFEVQTDNITPRNGDIRHPGGMRTSLSCWRKNFQGRTGCDPQPQQGLALDWGTEKRGFTGEKKEHSSLLACENCSKSQWGKTRLWEHLRRE